MARKPIAKIGPYTVVSELGRGGMGVVYRARHKDINRDIALKMISRDAGATDEQIERFRREAHAASKLASHPNIVGVHDVGEDEGVLYLAMDLIEGRPLDELAADGELTFEQVARIGEQVAHALAHAHAKKILHRDVKPSNVLVTEHLSAHLTDFGLARAQATDAANLKLTVAGELLGTPAYMPPEQARGEEVDHRADIYSLGATLYELAGGEPPFKGESIYSVIGQVLKKPPRPLRKLRPGVPADLETIIMTCLQKAPRARYQRAEQLADDLARFRLGAGIDARRSQVARGMRAAGGRGPLVWAGVAVVVVVAAVGGWFATRGRGGDAKPRPSGGGRSAGSGAGAKAAKATPRAAAWQAAHEAVVPATAEAFARLEDHWAGVRVDAGARDDAVRRIAATTRDAAKAHPGTKLPDAWRAYARWLAGEGAPAVEALRASAADAGGDPFPDVLLARLELSRWLAALDVALPWPALTEPEVAVPPIVERDIQRGWRAAAAEALERAAPEAGGTGAGDTIRAFATGARALARGEHAAAAEALRSLADDPTLGALAGCLRGAALRFAGRPADAVAPLEAVGKARGWPAAWRLAGGARLRAAAGGPAAERLAALTAATHAFEAARLAAPGERASLLGPAVAAWMEAAGAQVDGGDPIPALDRALGAWHAYLEQVPDDPAALAQQGAALVRKADWLARRGGAPAAEALFRSALDALGRAHEALPDDPAVVAALAEALAICGSFEAARGTDPEARWQRARGLVDAAIAAAPDAPAPRLARARLYQIWTNEGRLDRDRRLAWIATGVDDLTRVLNADEQHAAALARRADLENDRGLLEDQQRGVDPIPRFRAAVRDWSALLELRPGDRAALRGRGGARVNMGNALEEQGHDPTGAFQAAREDLDALLAALPDDVRGHLFRAHCCKGWGRWLADAGQDPSAPYTQAIVDYRFFLDRYPEDVGQRVNLGGTEINFGIWLGDRGQDPLPRYRDGVATLTAAIERDAANGTAWLFRGHGHNNAWNWLRRQGKPDPDWAQKAIVDYRKASELLPRMAKDLTGNIARLEKELAEAGK